MIDYSKLSEEKRKALQRYGDERTKEILKAYKKTQDDILRQVTKIFDKVMTQGTWTWIDMQKYNRAESLFNGLNEKVKELGEAEYNELKDLLTETYKEDYARKKIELYYQQKGKSYNELAKEFDLTDYDKKYYDLLKDPKGFIKVAFNTIDTKAVEKVLTYPWSGKNFSSRIWDEKELLIKTLREQLTQSMVQGESMQKAAKRIRKVMGNSAYNCTRLARTEIMRVSTEANMQAMEEDGITKIQWWSAEDERVCAVCGKLHMKVYKLGEEPIQPAHPQCRCDYIPYIE